MMTHVNDCGTADDDVFAALFVSLLLASLLCGDDGSSVDDSARQWQRQSTQDNKVVMGQDFGVQTVGTAML